MRRRLNRVGGIGAAVLFLLAVYLAYRWAEPSPEAIRAAHTSTGGGVTVRLENTPFAGYINGARTWSLHAGQVNLERQPNSSLSTIQSATLTDIKDGVLYEPPRASTAPVLSATTVTHTLEAGSRGTQGDKPTAMFHAKQGRYRLGTDGPVPAELEMAYTVQWEFRLTGDVEFRTQAGDTLTAPSLTIYNLVRKRNGKIEQRVVCDEGAKMKRKGIEVFSNRLRFSPKDRTVECLAGARGAFKNGAVQAERAFWSLDDETLRCPEEATGTLDSSPFTAQSLTLDVKHRIHRASHIHIEPLVEARSDGAAGGRLALQPGAHRGSSEQKRANLDLFDATVTEKTGVTAGRDFTFSLPQDKMTITGSKASYNKNTNVLETEGNLVMDDPNHHATGEKAIVDDSSRAKHAIITGGVVLLLKPKNSPPATNDINQEKSKGASVYCDRIDDYYARQFVILSGHLVFKQQIKKSDGKTLERILTAEHAEYDGKANRLHLFAPVDLKDTDNQSGHFDQDVVVGTKEGEETVQSKGRFSAVFPIGNEKPDEDTQPDAPAASPAAKNP